MTSSLVPKISTRRAALGIGGSAFAAGAASVLLSPSADAADPTVAQVGDALGLCIVTQYGAVSGQDSTTAINQAIAAASSSYRAVYFPPGDWILNSGITIPDGVHLVAAAPSTSRFGLGGPGGGRAFCRLRPSSASFSGTLVTLAGDGSGIENIMLDGGNAPCTLLAAQGFETTLHGLRCYQSTGIGIDVQRANNTRWHDVFVDNCGSSSLPAVKVWSKANTGSSGETNTFDINGLTIERSANVALEIAWGTTSEYYAEFVRIDRLHIEAGTDAPANVDPLVRIGNVRHVQFDNPFIYGGPGALIEHASKGIRQNTTSGGIRIIGGTLLGGDPNDASRVSPTLVKLTTGDDFSIVGSRLVRAAASSGVAVTVASTYGSHVEIDSETYTDGTLIVDSRTQQWVADGPSTTMQQDRNNTAVPIADSTPTDIASVTLTATRSGIATIVGCVDLSYATANDTIVVNAYLDGNQVGASAVYKSAAVGRVPLGRTWLAAITPGQRTITIKGFRYSGSGTNHQALALSNLAVIYQPS